jgi:dihydrofolate synthase/folylpolyglutamate synthase
MEILGPTLEEIAAEKSGIVKPGVTRTLVLGETRPELGPLFDAAGAGDTWLRGQDFSCSRNRVAHGGRVIELSTPLARYEDLFLPLHGSHQGENAAVALAAVEAFFGAALDPDVVAEGFSQVTSPGRMEVVGRRPLCILDGAHNPAGAEAAGATLAEEFGSVERRVVVMGVLQGRDVASMLEALDPPQVGAVVACAPPSPRALPPADLAAVAAGLGMQAEVVIEPARAVHRGLELAGPDDLVLVTGSLYVVGAARRELAGTLPGL